MIKEEKLWYLKNLDIVLLEKFGDGEGNIKLSLSHRELASLIGATREATTIALNELKDMGAIEAGRKRIRIIDREILEEVKGD